MPNQRRFKYLVLARGISYFVVFLKLSDSNKEFSEIDIIKMLKSLIDNICIMFDGPIFNRRSSTVMLFSSTCSFASLLMIACKGFSRKTRKSQSDHLISRSTIQNMFFSKNHFMLGDYVSGIYSFKLEIKDITDTARSASYIDLHLEPRN